jgi:hypothetical protein
MGIILFVLRSRKRLLFSSFILYPLSLAGVQAAGPLANAPAGDYT